MQIKKNSTTFKKIKWVGILAFAALLFQNFSELEVFQSAITAEEKALLIYQRTGVKSFLNRDRLIEVMTDLINRGDSIGAARLAIARPSFYNLIIRDFAAPMSNREEKVNVDLNDFIATVIGIARDDRDAREILNGNTIYWAPSSSNQSSFRNDVLRSNDHYTDLDENLVDLYENLQGTRQQVLTQAGAINDLEDTAGVITSRAFMSAHAAGGTNRRLVEFSFSQFLCSPIETWAAGGLGGGFVGRDIGRKPVARFRNRCSNCHGPMDSMRPAFAFSNFRDGFFQYKENYSFDPRPDDAARVDVPVPQAERLVPSKFRRGKEIFSNGHVVDNDTWFNFTSPNFEWRTKIDGSGMNSFGNMLANSKQFGRCMSQRAFKTLCYRNFNSEKNSNKLDDWADHFEDSGYSLRELFARVVSDDLCIGEQ